MTAFARFGTRFSISTAAPAKVAKSAKVDAGEAKLSQFSQVSQGAVPEPKNPSHHPLMHQGSRIAETLAARAEREADPDGWLVLVLPDGRRHVAAPHIVAALDAAGLLPDLPPAVSRSIYASTARPPAWSDDTDTPSEGDRCSCCGSGRWWTAQPAPDGWCCSTCHPPPLGRVVREVATHPLAAGAHRSSEA
jgi:hypothetical protein